MMSMYVERPDSLALSTIRRMVQSVSSAMPRSSTTPATKPDSRIEYGRPTMPAPRMLLAMFTVPSKTPAPRRSQSGSWSGSPSALLSERMRSEIVSSDVRLGAACAVAHDQAASSGTMCVDDIASASESDSESESRSYTTSLDAAVLRIGSGGRAGACAGGAARASDGGGMGERGGAARRGGRDVQ